MIDPSAHVVQVGVDGNEPVVRVAPDGTIYVSALQHLYRSTDGGATWTPISPPILATDANLNSDSSIDVSPDGSTIAMSFDWPYAGSTAVCESTDRGTTWLCDPYAVPGVTDRMWVHFLPDGRLFLETGVGLSVASSGFVQPEAGVPVFVPGTPQPVGAVEGQMGDVAQGWGPTAHDGVLLMPSTFGPTSMVRFDQKGGYVGSQPFTLNSTSIASLARDASGALYGTNETAHSLELVRYHGAFPALTYDRTTVVSGGTVTFSAIAAGPAGAVTMVFYWSPLGDGNWTPYSATTTNAAAASPTWTVRALADAPVHQGIICSSLSCGGTSRFAGDFLSATFDAQGNPWWSWMEERPNNAAAIMVGSTVAIVTPPPPPPPPPAPHSQNGTYTVPVGTLGQPCTGATATAYGCVLFQVPPNTTRALVAVHDAFSAHVGADVCFATCGAQAPFCDSILVTLPRGATSFEVYVDPDGFGVASYCPPRDAALPTTGVVTADFS